MKDKKGNLLRLFIHRSSFIVSAPGLQAKGNYRRAGPGAGSVKVFKGRRTLSLFIGPAEFSDCDKSAVHFDTSTDGSMIFFGPRFIRRRA